MNTRQLGALQVAALLVSASYGVGFLFGSGELALQHGMAGSLYGMATAAGMFILSLGARRLWAAGVPVWEWFGQAHGPALQRAVALLSMVWMAGVLAAQIHGGTAVAGLMGLPQGAGVGLVLALIFAASRLNLRFASIVFAFCLMASAIVLVYALMAAGGVPLYLDALPMFWDDLATFSRAKLFALTLAVCMLVCTGADYHQFVLAARRPADAVLGCVIAGLALVAIGLLPSALVVAAQQGGRLGGVLEAKQVIPLLLARTAAALGPGADTMLLVALCTAALGSGAAVLRAMTVALVCAAPASVRQSEAFLALLSLGLGAALAARGQGIVDTMVSVNVVYIASIAVCLVAMLGGYDLPSQHAQIVMAAGFGVSAAAYAVGWAGWKRTGDVDLVALLAGLGISLVVAVGLAVGAAWARRSPGTGG